MRSLKQSNLAHAYTDSASQEHPYDITRMEVCISELLGYDYVFLSGESAIRCFEDKNSATEAVIKFVELLGLKPEHTVFVSVTLGANDEPKFTRHDASWSNRHITQLKNTLVSNPEQRDFIKMIWQCSSEYNF